MAKHRKSRRASKRSRRTTRRHRRTYGGAWYDPRTWFSQPSTSNTLAVSTLAPKSTISNLFAPTQRNRTRSVSPVLPSQEGSRFLLPKTRFAAENTVYNIPKLGSSPVGNSSKTSTARLRPNMAANAFNPSSRGAENALVARHVAELFQRSNSKQNMFNYLDRLQVAPHIKKRIENQFVRNYGNAFNNNNSTITDNNSVVTNNNNRNNTTRRHNNAAAAAYGVGSAFMW